MDGFNHSFEKNTFFSMAFQMSKMLSKNGQVLKFLEEEIQSFEKLFEELNGEFLFHNSNMRRIVK